MALGAALATGKPQVYAVVPGPGLLNSAAALLTAYGMNAPVLALIGQIAQSAIGRGLGHLHEIRDQAGIIARLVDFSARIREPTRGRAASSPRRSAPWARGRPGPAVLECAIDVWGRSAPVAAIAPPSPPPQPPIDEDAIAAAAKRLAAAKRPLIVAGGGAQDAAAEVTELSRLLQAPVLAYRRGRGVLDSRDPLERHAAARPRAVGRGRRGARRRHAAVLRLHAMGHRRRASRSSASMPIPRSRNGSRGPRSRSSATPRRSCAACSMRSPRITRRLAPRRRWRSGKPRCAGASTSSRRRSAFSTRSARSCRRTASSSTRSPRSALPRGSLFPVYKPRTFLSPGYQDNLGWGYATALGAQHARARRAGAVDLRRRRLSVHLERARHRHAPSHSADRRRVQRRRLRQCAAHPGGAATATG